MSGVFSTEAASTVRRFRFIKSSGAARARATGVNLAMKEHPGGRGLLPEMGTSRFSSTLFSKEPSWPFHRPS